MSKRKLVVFYMTMILIVCFVTYASLEMAARLGFPDPALIRFLERELASAESIENYLDSKELIYGWDQALIPGLSTDLSASINKSTYTILFSGDSVTRGLGVDVTKESYPMLLLKNLNEKTNVRVLNAAVMGFGVDQMVLKLEEVVPRYRPDLIVFAYIPHDLWRPAREINFGYTKPILIPEGSGKWKIVPAPNIIQFYKNYSNAKRGYYLGLWSLRHFTSNLRYYFPKLHTRYYRGLFEEIRDRLLSLGERYDAEILIVRLASTWPGGSVLFLDRIAQHLFAAPSDFQGYHYFDSEECVRAKSVALEIDYDKEFKTHPGPVGHEIYSDCLLDPLRALSVARRHRITK